MEPYFLTFQDQDRIETTTGIAPDVQVLVFQEQVTRTVMGGPLQQEFLLVTPGGVPGLQGPVGPPGPGGAFVHIQDAPAATWTIAHNLGTKPAIVLELASDPTGLVFTDITYPDLNTAVIEWPAPETGKAYI